MRAGLKAVGIIRKPVRINGLLRKGYHLEQFREPVSRYVRDLTLPGLSEIKNVLKIQRKKREPNNNVTKLGTDKGQGT
jgi:hypothetical protein